MWARKAITNFSLNTLITANSHGFVHKSLLLKVVLLNTETTVLPDRLGNRYTYYFIYTKYTYYIIACLNAPGLNEYETSTRQSYLPSCRWIHARWLSLMLSLTGSRNLLKHQSLLGVSTNSHEMSRSLKVWKQDCKHQTYVCRSRLLHHWHWFL